VLHAAAMKEAARELFSCLPLAAITCRYVAAIMPSLLLICFRARHAAAIDAFLC